MATFALPPRVVTGGDSFDPEDGPGTEQQYLAEDEVQFFEDFSAACERLRQDPEAWAQYQADQERWDAFVFWQLPEEGSDVPTKSDSGDADTDKPDHS